MGVTKNKAFVGIASLLGILCLLMTTAYAGVGVTPAMFISDFPGSRSFSFKVTNTKDSSVQMVVTPAGLKVGPTGQVIPQESQKDLKAAAKIFHPDPASFQLPAHASREVTINVTPLENAKGGIYGAILVAEKPPETQKAMVASIGRIAVPVLFDLPGPSTKTGTVTATEVTQEGVGAPIQIRANFRDTGNIHFHVTGRAVIENQAGKKIAGFPLGTHTVIPPGRDRLFSGQWKPKELPAGDYTVKANMEIEDGPTVTSTANFHVIAPNKLLKLGGEIMDFPAPKAAHHEPITFELLFHNSSNIPLLPKGGIDILDKEGNSLATVPIAMEEEIAPDSSGRLTGTLKQGMAKGAYRASAKLDYGKPEHNETKTAKAQTNFTVTGEPTIIDGKIVKFNVPSVESGQPVVPELVVKNTGNTDFDIQGLIKIKTNKGKSMGQVALHGQGISVGESKNLETQWKGDLSKGLHKAEVILVLNGEKTLTAKTTFLVK